MHSPNRLDKAGEMVLCGMAVANDAIQVLAGDDKYLFAIKFERAGYCPKVARRLFVRLHQKQIIGQ
jgi:hypothetical protein